MNVHIRAIVSRLINSGPRKYLPAALALAPVAVFAQVTATFDLPAQPLAESLKAVGTQTNTNLLVAPELVDGKQARELRASLTVDQAITELLKGTGITYRYLGERTIVLGAGKPVAEAVRGQGAERSTIHDGGRSGVWVAQADAAGQAAEEGQGLGKPETSSGGEKLEEIVVTASRRRQTLEEVPYSVTAVSADQIARAGVTDIASLASQVPGLSMYNFGARLFGATTPIIRGINATDAAIGAFRTFEQSPVGSYIGNSPIDGYFQLDDIQRVEVLRGPQGTLYGAGALGGALRVIPNQPKLDSFSSNIELSGGTVAHSSSASYGASGMLNVPFADTLGFRLSGKYAYEPGFINVYGILKRTGSPISGIPVLADPADPVNSSGVFTGKDDWNYQKTFTGRASLLWKPADKFSADIAFTYANVKGDGGPTAISTFPGGPYPIDPRITFPRGGDYQEFAPTDEPFSRRTTLASVDLSYDAGFATVSSTSSYYTTNGSTILSEYGIAAFPTFIGYYAGNPVNPRYINPSLFDDLAHTFTQEVRLVSNTSPDKRFDYVLGLFYEKQRRQGAWIAASPGSPEYSVAQGCTAPYYYDYANNTGAPFPNCLVTSGPGGAHYNQIDIQHFEDKSVFAELTWHFAPHGQVTFGARHFKQSFTDSETLLAYTFGVFVRPGVFSAPASKNTWKINPSYEYATNQHVYALWSQGFRRGGSNSFQTHPPLPPERGENAALLNYAPDAVNNYEIGLKGHFANGLRYSIDVFDIQWDNPQISGALPSGNFAVWNAKKAAAKGVEFDLASPLFLPGLSITAGGAYTDATLSESFDIPADIYGNIVGKAGQQLNGSPKVSAVATINYNRSLAAGYALGVSLNDTYQSDMFLSTFPEFGQTERQHVPGLWIANFSASISHESWRLGVYVTNLTDKRAILAPPVLQNFVDNLTNHETINQPREIYLRLGYSF